MPFSPNLTAITGHVLSVRPERGYGWAVVEAARIVEELAVPAPFDCEIRELLFDSAEARALVCSLGLRLGERLFLWAAFIPRTDLIIDLRERTVGCNILLSDQKPYVDSEADYPDPRHVWTSSKTHVRGFGRVSLLGIG